MEKKALKKPEVCEMLGISLGTLNKLLQTKKLRTIRIGERGVRVALADVERFISGQE